MQYSARTNTNTILKLITAQGHYKMFTVQNEMTYILDQVKGLSTNANQNKNNFLYFLCKQNKNTSID